VRYFHYFYVIREIIAVLIDVRYTEPDAADTKVNVAYERTALSPEANEHVKELGNADRESGTEWGSAINDYLAKQKIGAHWGLGGVASQTKLSLSLGGSAASTPSSEDRSGELQRNYL
jgi:hypothetical protein